MVLHLVGKNNTYGIGRVKTGPSNFSGYKSSIHGVTNIVKSSSLEIIANNQDTSVEKVDVYVEGGFAERLDDLKTIEARSEKNEISTKIAYEEMLDCNWVDPKIKHERVKQLLMEGDESEISTRSKYYLALLYMYRQLVNIHYIKESRN